MFKTALFIIMQFSLVTCFSQFAVSADKHNLLRDGKPFFWMGDTGWELFHRLTLQEADYYLNRRSQQGFTVIQAAALAELDGLHTPNAYGELPLLGDDPEKPNEAYFRIVDTMIDLAAAYGLVIGFLPTWGDKVCKAWGTGPEIFTPRNARAYGKWLGNRYKNKTNIIWILGGDRNPQNPLQLETWREMAVGITEGVGGRAKALISYHPQPNADGSAAFFDRDKWFAFNMFQNGHCRDEAVYDKIGRSYAHTPGRPVVDGEPIYEDHPVCFNVQDLGTSAPYDVRRYAYLELLSGSCGHTYGCHDVWQFYSPGRPAVNGPHFYWQQAMELPGANQMNFLKKLMLSRPLLDRVPDQSLIAENDLAASERIQAAKGKNYLFVYSAAGMPFTLNLGKLDAASLNLYWYDPRTGTAKKLGMVMNSGSILLVPPSGGYGQDWVLIADDTAANYPLPGMPQARE